jgi:hypothetical protein
MKTIISLIIIQCFLFVFSFSTEIKNVNHLNEIRNKCLLPTARYINDNFKKDAKLAVYFDAGIIPYLTKLETLDLSGLLDKDLAMNEYENKGKVGKIFTHRLNRLFEFNPDVVVISTKQPSLTKDAFIEWLKNDPRWGEYKLKTFFGVDNYYELIYEH